MRPVDDIRRTRVIDDFAECLIVLYDVDGRQLFPDEVAVACLNEKQASSEDFRPWTELNKSYRGVFDYPLRVDASRRLEHASVTNLIEVVAK